MIPRNAPTARPTHMPTRPCHPTAWHKVEAVCKHFLSVASDERPRQKLLRAEVSGMAMGKSSSVENKKVENCFCPPPFTIYFFPLPDKSFCHVLRARTCLIIFFPCGAKAKHSHKQKVLARAYGRLFILRGEGGGGHAPFSCAPFSSQAPPAPPYACSGARLRTSRLTHEYC